MFKWIFLRNKQNRRILYFGFDYLYWGSIIGRIARGFYEDGAKLVIHIANLGSCREPKDIGSSIFIPMIFMRIETRGSTEFIPIQWNPILQLNQDYNSGIHACVRSPLDETYEPFRKVVTRIGATSVETEAFHIEKAANEVNQGRKNKVGFSGIYLATDYVRKPGEKISLTLTKKAKVRRIRKNMLPYCARIVAEYLNTLTDTPEAE